MSHKTPNPKHVFAVFHSTCNYNCRFCGQGEAHKGKHWEYSQITDELNDLWKDAETASITGIGEIGLVPYLNDLLDYFSQRDIKTNFVSNGYHLDIPRIRQSLLGHITISLHTLDEPTYDNLTGTKGKLPQVLQNVRLLAEKPRSYKFEVVAVITNLNAQHGLDIAKFCDSVGVDVLRFTPLVDFRDAKLPNGYDPDLILQETPENMAALEEARLFLDKDIKSEREKRCATVVTAKERRKTLIEKMPRCISPHQQVVIGIDGEVCPCCFLASVVLGNVFETPWTEIWNGEPYRKFRKDVKSGKCESCLEYCLNWG